MTGFRFRRVLWLLLAVLAAGVVLFHAAQQLVTVPAGHLDRTAAALAQWRRFLEHYGPWLHLGAHGATYLYLILCWSRLVGWINRRRAARGHMPLSPVEQRRLVIAVVAACLVYESLLMLRYLD